MVYNISKKNHTRIKKRMIKRLKNIIIQILIHIMNNNNKDNNNNLKNKNIKFNLLQ